MARHCHTQMPTSYLSYLCQDKTHEAGMESSSWEDKIWGETLKEERRTLTLQRLSVSNQQNFISSVLSGTDTQSQLFSECVILFMQMDLQLESIFEVCFKFC